MNVSDIDKSVESPPEGTSMCTVFEESSEVRDIWQYFPSSLNVGLWLKDS